MVIGVDTVRNTLHLDHVFQCERSVPGAWSNTDRLLQDKRWRKCPSVRTEVFELFMTKYFDKLPYLMYGQL